MNAHEAAEQLSSRIVRNTPENLDESDVSITRETHDITGEVETYVLLELPTPPEKHASAEELRGLTDKQAKQLHRDKEQYYDEVRDFITSVTSVVKNLAGSDHEIVGFNEFGTTTPSRTQYYAVRVCAGE